MLDSAHVGDIRGAFGTIGQHEHGRHGLARSRLLALLAIIGPGLIVMVGDNDAGGVATYAQAGQNYGTSLLWVLLLLIPVLIVNQEMVVRLGAVTGVGHARLINERFGRFWGWFSVGDLFLLNFLTIVTEFIGDRAWRSATSACQPVHRRAHRRAGPGRHHRDRQLPTLGAAHVPLRGRQPRWSSRWSLLAHPHAGPRAPRLLRARASRAALTSTAVLLIIAIVGTTVAPWQLFFQQSNVVDKRITPRWINTSAPTPWSGAFVVVIGAGAHHDRHRTAFAGTASPGTSPTPARVARALASTLSPTLGAVFAVLLIDASVIGAARSRWRPATPSATSSGSATRCTARWRDAKLFYGVFTGHGGWRRASC